MNDLMNFVASKTFHYCCFQSFFHTWFSSTLFGKAGLPWHQLKIRWTHNLQPYPCVTSATLVNRHEY